MDAQSALEYFGPEQLSSSCHLWAVVLWCREENIAEASPPKLRDSEKKFAPLWASSCSQQTNVWLTCLWSFWPEIVNVFLPHCERFCSVLL